jgi:hypothetical protein
MTIKLFQSAAATLRRAGSFAKVVVRALGAEPPSVRRRGNANHEATPGRYFGLLVHVDRSDR